MGDTFTVVPQDLAEDLHLHISSVERTIRFTKEVEAKVSFLDVMVSREEDREFKTEVYRKPTHT